MSSSKNLEYQKTSFLSKTNSSFIEEMYFKFINQDKSLPESWKRYFEDIGEDLNVVAKELNGPSWNSNKKKIDVNKIQNNLDYESNVLEKNQNINSISEKEIAKMNGQSIKAVSMIRSYRQRGHLIATLDPLEMREIDYLDELHPESYGFKKEDYNNKIYLDGVINRKYSSIREILSFLKKTYCEKIGYEYMHISNPTERKWFRDRIELSEDNLNFTKNGKKAILNKLIQELIREPNPGDRYLIFPELSLLPHRLLIP